MTRFRTRLLAAAGVTAVLFAGALLAAMQSADSQPMRAGGAESGANGLPAACAGATESGPRMWADDGYYQTEYAARRRCDPAAAVVQ
jgi:hypothetical protein